MYIHVLLAAKGGGVRSNQSNPPRYGPEMLFSNSRLLDSLVCCEAVRWAILATAWLLVIIVTYEYRYSVEWCCAVWQHGVAPCGQTRPREGCTLLADARC